MMISNKLGIITLPLHQNYGGVLQAFALCSALKMMGYNAYILASAPQSMKDRVKQTLYRNSSFGRFVYTNIPCLKVDYGKLEQECQNHKIDTIIMGSDQIWRYDYLNTDIKFGGWIKSEDMKVLSYAASFGFDKWKYQESDTKRIELLLKRFCAVSVREKSAVGICKSILNQNAIHVLDPTMLLSKADYLKIIPDKKDSSRYVFSYLLDDSNNHNLNCVDYLKSNLGIDVKSVNLYKNKLLKRLCKQTSIIEWLSLICYADIVITDSFHGTVFSILFHTPFYVLLNRKGGNTRLYSLLESFGLENRIICSVSDMNLSDNIDWNDVEKRHMSLYHQSLTFLKEALK